MIEDGKRCGRCGRRLPWESFGRNLGATDGHQSWCRDCQRDHRKNGTPPKTKEPTMSRLLDLMIDGGEVSLQYDPTKGIVATALHTDADHELIESDGQADIDAALDSLEDKLGKAGRRGPLAQRLERRAS